MSVDLPTFQPSRFGCPLCGKPSLSLADKKRHMRKYHPKVKKGAKR